jgi:DDE superfamily endonuclease
VDSWPLDGAAGDAARVMGRPHPVLEGDSSAFRGGRGRCGRPGYADGGTTDHDRSSRGCAHLAPFSYDVTERRIGRPQDVTEQTRCYSGKKKLHTVKKVLLINAALIIPFLIDTYPGSTHDKRIAEATLLPLLAGSRLLQDLGFLAFALDQIEMLMPTKKPRGGALTRVQKLGIGVSPGGVCASSMSTAASSAVASSTTPTTSGKLMSAIRSWKSAARCITFASV